MYLHPKFPTCVAIGQKVTFVLLITLNLAVVPFGTYAPFPTIPLFLKCILEI
jgi:hypothetical protein